MDLNILNRIHQSLNSLPKHIQIEISDDFDCYGNLLEFCHFFDVYNYANLIEELDVEGTKSIKLGRSMHITFYIDGEPLEFIIFKENTSYELLNSIKYSINEYKEIKEVADKIEKLEGVRLNKNSWGVSSVEPLDNGYTIFISLTNAHKDLIKIEVGRSGRNTAGLSKFNLNIDAKEYLSEDISIMDRIRKIIPSF